MGESPAPPYLDPVFQDKRAIEFQFVNFHSWGEQMLSWYLTRIVGLEGCGTGTGYFESRAMR